MERSDRVLTPLLNVFCHSQEPAANERFRVWTRTPSIENTSTLLDILLPDGLAHARDKAEY